MNNNDKVKQKEGINPIMAGITGAVVGAGVAVAASKVLKKEKTRKKVKDVLSNVKDQTIGYVQNFNTTSNNAKDAKKTKKVVKKTKRGSK